MAEVSDDAIAFGDGDIRGFVYEFVQRIGSCQLG